MSSRRSLLAQAILMPAVGASLLSRGAGAAEAAQGFPSQPVRVLVPLAPGGSMDAFSRLLGERLSRIWSVPVVVENRPGANGMIGATALTTAPANGYTVLFSHSSIVLNPLLRASPGYRLSQFTPVVFLADLPVAFGLAQLQATSVAGFVALAKSRPGELAYGSYGAGSVAHILGELLQRRTGISLVHVPYRGESEAITALLGGQIAAMFGSVGGVSQQGERIAFAAVGNARRLERFPDVPTFDEVGLALGDLSGWAGAFVPAETPAPITAKLAADLRQVLAQEDIISRTRDLGFEPRGAEAPPFDDFVRKQTRLWAAAIRDAAVSVE